PAAVGGERRVETRAEVERLAEERGTEVSSEVVSLPDQEPVIVGGGGEQVEEVGVDDPFVGADDAGVPLTLFAGLDGELTLIPMRMGESFAVLSDRSGFDIGDEGVFLTDGSMFSVGAFASHSGVEGQPLFFVCVLEADRGSEPELEGEEP
ncbi:MAG: hypothetical protein P8J87_10235, partial [Verrucomicrobiales bacterium]|nr:hypothetical protein [Verrucomicrobiales bacterium]